MTLMEIRPVTRRFWWPSQLARPWLWRKLVIRHEYFINGVECDVGDLLQPIDKPATGEESMTTVKNAALSLLGKRVSDVVTKFEGIVSSLNFDLYGCVQALVQPGVVKDDKGLPKTPDSQWFDIKRLTVEDHTPVMRQPSFDGEVGTEIGGVAKPGFQSPPKI